jgi:hypothetical protein
MQKIILYISIALITLVSTVNAQEKTFEQKAKEIAVNIKTIAEEEKKALKAEVEAIDKAVELGKMTKEDADKAKTKIAEERAKNIETKTAVQETALRDLVNGKLEFEESNDSLKKNSFSIPGGYKSKKHNEKKSENRTTSQMVLAFGNNNVLTDGNLAHSVFKFNKSGFFEIGHTWNSRIAKNSNIAHFKYGFSVQYNELVPTNNTMFAESGNQTILVSLPVILNKIKFRNVNLVVPMHFEFDFSKTKEVDGNKIFKSHQGVRLGLGGYAGFNVKSKQKIWFDDANGNNVMQSTKGDYNVNDFVYGLSTYIGYKQTSLYLKYDLSPVFENNIVDQNNISLGLRFDWN